MKKSIHITGVCLLLLSGVALAEVPKKAPITKYSALWTNSPFTSKPLAPEAGPTVNPLDDYALAGVSPVGNGYRVTLLNRKNPEERIVVESSRPNAEHGFKISSVNRKAGNPLGTTVVLNKGSISGTVEFDEALLTLKAPPVQAPPQQNPPGVIPGQPNNQPQGGGQRQPRPRVVPPPPGGAQQQQQQQGQNAGRGGNQQQNTQGRERADRRRR